MTTETIPKKKRGRPPQWTPEQDALLGQFSDCEIARRLGKARITVRYRRTTLDIPACPGAGSPLINWTPETQALIGTMSDRQLAAQLNLAHQTVSVRRRALRIAPFKTTIPYTHAAIDAAKVRARREAIGLNRHALAEGKAALEVLLGRLEREQQKSVRETTLQRLCALLRCQPEDITVDK